MSTLRWNEDPLTWAGAVLTWNGGETESPPGAVPEWSGGRRRGGRSLYVGSSPVPPWAGYDDDPKFWSAVRERRKAAEARRVSDEAQRADDERRARAARAVARPKAPPKPKPDPWREQKAAVRQMIKVAEIQDRQMILDTLWGLIDSGALSPDLRAMIEQAIEAV